MREAAEGVIEAEEAEVVEEATNIITMMRICQKRKQN